MKETSQQPGSPSQNSTYSMESGNLSQEGYTGLYPEPDESSPHPKRLSLRFILNF